MKLVLMLLIFMSSCASYVNSIHSQIDNEEKAQRRRYQKRFQNVGSDKRPIQNPVTLGGSATANTTRTYNAQDDARYASRGVRRYKARDLKDNQNDGSLWSGQNSESFLFVTNNLKRRGDIVIINVYSDFKSKIKEELARAYPVKKSSAKKSAEKPAAAPEEKDAAEEADSPDKIYDKISTSVVEVINKDYLLLRGRKEVIYKKYKRYFEIQAVVSQKDVDTNDSVSSKKLLEPQIHVLRY